MEDVTASVEKNPRPRRGFQGRGGRDADSRLRRGRWPLGLRSLAFWSARSICCAMLRNSSKASLEIPLCRSKREMAWFRQLRLTATSKIRLSASLLVVQDDSPSKLYPPEWCLQRHGKTTSALRSAISLCSRSSCTFTNDGVRHRGQPCEILGPSSHRSSKNHCGI